MGQINSIIPFVFEDMYLKINNHPVLIPSNNILGRVDNAQVITMMTGKFQNKEDLLETLSYIGLDIDPKVLDLKKKSYCIRYKDSNIQVTVEDMYQQYI